MRTQIVMDLRKEKLQKAKDDANLTDRKKLADAYYKLEDRLDDAIQIYTDILAQFPNDIETLLALGCVSVDLNQPNEAQVFFCKVLDLDPLNDAARTEKIWNPRPSRIGLKLL